MNVTAFLSSLIDDSQVIEKLALSMLIVLSLIAGRWLILRVLQRRDISTAARYRWTKTSRYIVAFLSILIIGALWLNSLSNFATYLGLLSAGLAIALSQPISNLAGWAIIIFRHPFELGDRIQIGAARGDVIDQGMFVFTLMEVGNWVDAEQSTGRVIHVPNAKVFSENVENYTQGFQFIWHEVPVLITFESNWRDAKQILSEIADRNAIHLTPEAERQFRQAASRFMITSGTLTPKVYTRVLNNGVELTLRFLSDPRQRRSADEAIWEEILDAFAARTDIEFAYPTQRFYLRPDNQNQGNTATTFEIF